MAGIRILIQRPEDNVATALSDLAAGESVQAGGHRVTVRQPIPFGHKLALVPIPAGATVIKYGAPIGRATATIAPGEHVHVHNVESARGRGDLPHPDPTRR